MNCYAGFLSSPPPFRQVYRGSRRNSLLLSDASTSFQGGVTVKCGVSKKGGSMDGAVQGVGVCRSERRGHFQKCGVSNKGGFMNVGAQGLSVRQSEQWGFQTCQLAC